MPIVWSGSHNGIAYDKFSEPARSGAGYRGGSPPHTHPRETYTYRFSFPKHLSRLCCLVGVSIWTNLWIHFAHRHVQDTIVILK